jgi:hypothetical protein
VGVVVLVALAGAGAGGYLGWRKARAEGAKAAGEQALSAARVSGERTQIEDFFSFQGISFGDREEDVERKLGPPPRTSNLSSRKWFVYEASDLHFSCDEEGRVISMYVSSPMNDERTPQGPAPMAEAPAAEPRGPEAMGRSLLLGLTRAEILARYGSPESVAPFTNFYSCIENGRKLRVVFQYSRTDYRCCNVSVMWEYPVGQTVTVR